MDQYFQRKLGKCISNISVTIMDGSFAQKEKGK